MSPIHCETLIQIDGREGPGGGDRDAESAAVEKGWRGGHVLEGQRTPGKHKIRSKHSPRFPGTCKFV